MSGEDGLLRPGRFNRNDLGMEAVLAPHLRRPVENGVPATDFPPFIAHYGGELAARFGQSFTPAAEIGAATGVEFLANGSLEAVAEPVRRGGGDAEVVCPEAGGDHCLDQVREEGHASAR